MMPIQRAVSPFGGNWRWSRVLRAASGGRLRSRWVGRGRGCTSMGRQIRRRCALPWRRHGPKASPRSLMSPIWATKPRASDLPRSARTRTSSSSTPPCRATGGSRRSMRLNSTGWCAQICARRSCSCGRSARRCRNAAGDGSCPSAASTRRIPRRGSPSTPRRRPRRSRSCSPRRRNGPRTASR